MRKIAGWSLIVTGGAYPSVLTLFWIIGLFTLLVSGRIIGLEHLIGMVWPLGLVVSTTLLFVGVWLVKSRIIVSVKEAHNANKQR